MRYQKYFLIWLCSGVLTACAVFSSVNDRHMAAGQLVADAGWQRMDLNVGSFVLAAFVPPQLVQTETLTIYIEGDGLAWLNAHTPSFDPTPQNPLALKLALSDTAHPAVYLARPCQYVMVQAQRHCDTKYWTSHRFSPEVIEASDQAIAELKRRYRAQHLILVGYSGGGAVAALVAARRHDIAQLMTIAGNLDTTAWASSQHLSPLTGSLNPADFWQALLSVPQLHLIGEHDRVIDPLLTIAFQQRFPEGKQPTVIIVPAFDHHCCWLASWPKWMVDSDALRK
ncbi:hypothetical protein [Methylophilus sp. OH31]|uniref:hypothetical protein n=1 Tax=Methylophilus sp. OH31 TaxID=1387312 RepID=UPI0004675261|nr:hypothetical protein [Methylophilus sp. OH31]